MPQTLIIDVDGTLVDSNYQHVLAWQRAFRRVGVQAEAWLIHRYIGKGGDQMVASVAGDDVERESGDAIREIEAERFRELIEEVEAFPDAVEFIESVAREGSEVILASSAKSDEVDHYLGLLGDTDLISAHTTSADVEATKPEPDLVQSALAKSEGDSPLMIGDSIWDVESARRAGLDCLAVLTGGFSKGELRATGAREIQPSLTDLIPFLPGHRVQAT